MLTILYKSVQKAIIDIFHPACLMSKKEAVKYYDECKEALMWGIKEFDDYLDKNRDFKIGKMMRDSWKLSLDERTMKELSLELIRSWQNH